MFFSWKTTLSIPSIFVALSTEVRFKLSMLWLAPSSYFRSMVIILGSSIWRWGGCSDNIKMGEHYAIQILDSLESGQDAQALTNLHNNYAGRLVSLFPLGSCQYQSMMITKSVQLNEIRLDLASRCREPKSYHHLIINEIYSSSFDYSIIMEWMNLGCSSFDAAVM